MYKTLLTLFLLPVTLGLMTGSKRTHTANLSKNRHPVTEEWVVAIGYFIAGVAMFTCFLSHANN